MQENRTFVMELWDVGANPKFKKSRRVFYKPTASSGSSTSLERDIPDIQGLILVHDLANRKSYANLTGWLREVMREISSTNEIVWDHDLLFDQGNGSLPVIVVGTKADLVDVGSRASELAEEGVDSIEISTQDPNAFAPGSTAFTKLTAFFDKVVLNRDHQMQLQQQQRFGTDSSSTTISPIPLAGANRHPLLDTDTFENTHVPTYPPQNGHYQHVTRNQRHMTPRILPDSSDYAIAGPSPGFRSEIPHIALPHSRQSQTAYTNILDGPN
jgi:GTPase SAR1 family protein